MALCGLVSPFEHLLEVEGDLVNLVNKPFLNTGETFPRNWRKKKKTDTVLFSPALCRLFGKIVICLLSCRHKKRIGVERKEEEEDDDMDETVIHNFFITLQSPLFSSLSLPHTREDI